MKAEFRNVSMYCILLCVQKIFWFCNFLIPVAFGALNMVAEQLCKLNFDKTYKLCSFRMDFL